ncbi:MAG: sigma-70 family RNA polymerase sigma factor [Planctomycetes bacterium]|nr:sigma-70 family RNA polymerase sigma factor [Planctomycetota bacterium]
MSEPDSPITKLLARLSSGDSDASGELLEVVYEQLRSLARASMQKEASGSTLQPTALVHEAWLRVLGRGRDEFENRRHFFASAAIAMRRILVDAARRRKAKKRGGTREHVDLEQVDLVIEPPDDRVIAVDEAVRALELTDPRKGEIVNLRYFVGLTAQETAAALGISISTLEREWRFIRAYLQRVIGDQDSPA